jgi:hypothetical protein
MSFGSYGQPAAREYSVRPYNQRMARRVARRAHVDDEGAVAVAYTFNNLATTVVLSVVVDVAKFIPIIGGYVDLLISVLAFYFHRIVLVTEQNVYVFRDWPFHIPGKRLLVQQRGPGVVQLGSPGSNAFMRFIRRGQLTFADGTIVYHSFVFIRRAQYIVQEANIPAGQ